MKHFFFASLILLLGISSCKKETVTEYVYLSDSWKPVEEFDRLQMYMTDCYVWEGNLNIGSPYGAWCYEKDGGRYSLADAGGFRNNHQYQDDHVISYSSNFDYIVIGGSQSGHRRLLTESYTKDLPGYSGFFSGDLGSHWAAIRTDKSQFMFSYYDTNDYAQMYGFVDYHVNTAVLIIDSVFAGQMNKEVVYAGINIQSFYNKYFIFNGMGMETADGNGVINKVTSIPDDKYFNTIIKKGDLLYAFGQGCIYTSSNEGNSWNPLLTDVPKSVVDFMRMNYSLLDDQIILEGDDQILHMIEEDGEIEFKPLLQDGLEHRWITGMERWKDEVIVTTTSGTFSKPYSDFFNYE